jgi:C4-dicarboxylate-specific signal transduction histidine kinase
MPGSTARSRREQYVMVAVSDNGTGMPSEVAARPFFSRMQSKLT